MLFTATQTALAAAAALFIAGSLVSYIWKRRVALSLLLLLCGALLLRFFYATLDPFLNTWDEQFHALAAKNMLDHPLVPTLYEDLVLPHDGYSWAEAHVWLHKQPLFLWQIALSYKIFGIGELSTRLPGILLSALVVLLIYRIGKNSVNERAGFIGAWLYAVAFYSLDLILGRAPTDHNDVSFHFYIAASIWAWTEYKVSGKLEWVILTGLFSGMSVLVKWLTGLLVFSGWGASMIAIKNTRTKLSSYLHIAGAFAIGVLVFLPWQIYIMNEFPVESAHNYKLNTLHFTDVVDGHGGDAWFYFHNLGTLYGGGQLAPYLVIPVVIHFLYQVKDAALRVGFATFISVVYLFFTLAATKMMSFCYIVSPLIFLSLGTAVDSAVTWVDFKAARSALARVFGMALVLGLGFLCFDTSRFVRHHVAWRMGKDPTYSSHYKQMQIIRSLKSELLPNTVLLNCKPYQHIAAMFYNDCIAYARITTEEETAALKEKRYNIVVLDDHKLPWYIVNDPSIKKIDKEYHPPARN
jgi:4-amino-4-deoxy-L-arabinose transferase-like glycosyltransferase